jgi:hypothetical protein
MAVYYIDNTITDVHVASGVPDYATYNPVTFSVVTGFDNVFKTINDVNACVFLPGDSVLFRKGQTWIGTLTIPEWVVIGSFGVGPNPIIKPDVLTKIRIPLLTMNNVGGLVRS